MKTFFKASTFISLAFLLSAGTVGAQTASESALIQSLLQQIQTLQAQIQTLIAQQSGSTTSNFSIGNTGPAVETLQKQLVTQGYLVMPQGASYGYYGPITDSALKRSQGITVANTTSNSTSASSSGTSPSVSFSASPSSISTGGSSTLSWSAWSGATNCAASGNWSGSKATSGSEVVRPTGTSFYSIVCTGAGGTRAYATTVVGLGGYNAQTVLQTNQAKLTNTQPVTTTQTNNQTTTTTTTTTASTSTGSDPVLDIKINGSNGPIYVNSGQSFNVSWSASGDVTECFLFRPLQSGLTSYSAVSSSGSESSSLFYLSTQFNTRYSYGFQCGGTNGSVVRDAVSVYVNNPYVETVVEESDDVDLDVGWYLTVNPSSLSTGATSVSLPANALSSITTYLLVNYVDLFPNNGGQAGVSSMSTENVVCSIDNGIGTITGNSTTHNLGRQWIVSFPVPGLPSGSSRTYTATCSDSTTGESSRARFTVYFGSSGSQSGGPSISFVTGGSNPVSNANQTIYAGESVTVESFVNGITNSNQCTGNAVAGAFVIQFQDTPNSVRYRTTLSPTQTTQYIITCTNSNGSTTKDFTITVLQPQAYITMTFNGQVANSRTNPDITVNVPRGTVVPAVWKTFGFDTGGAPEQNFFLQCNPQEVWGPVTDGINPDRGMTIYVAVWNDTGYSIQCPDLVSGQTIRANVNVRVQ